MTSERTAKELFQLLLDEYVNLNNKSLIHEPASICHRIRNAWATKHINSKERDLMWKVISDNVDLAQSMFGARQVILDPEEDYFWNRADQSSRIKFIQHLITIL